MPHHGSDKFCWLCEADRSDERSWTNFSAEPGAHWMCCPRPRQYFIDNPNDHLVYKIWGLTPMALALDALHILDLGVFGHVVANVCHTIVFDGAPGNRHEKMAELSRRLQELYEQYNITNRVQKFGLKIFLDKTDAPFASYPALHKCKASMGGNSRGPGVALDSSVSNATCREYFVRNLVGSRDAIFDSCSLSRCPHTQKQS